MMALSGVRSSWLMLATNCDLCSLAPASCRLLSWISSSCLAFSIAIRAWSREGRDQLDLLVGEWPNFLAVDDDGADQLIFLEHWHRQTRPSPGSVHCRDAQRIAIEIGLF